MSRSEDLLLLLTCGLALGACERAVDPDDGASGGGDDREAVDDAVDLCGPWAQSYVACFDAETSDPEYSGYALNYVTMVGSCITQVGYAQSLGDDCMTAYGDYFACLGALDCDELIGDVETENSDDDGGGVEPEQGTWPCAAEEEALEAVCDGPSVDSDQGRD